MTTDRLIAADGKRVALAVSGGIDSMVMLHFVAQKEDLSRIFVVTVNHGLRSEAASDCAFVANYCKSLGVECKIFNVDVPSYSSEQKLSVETAARILRYEVFDGLDCDCIYLAHNADDNAETVLMHIFRGSGAKGACGMRYVQGKYVRPLLDWTRAEIEQYARLHNVPHVEDATNADTRYTRNFIRHKVMPLLEEFYPSVKQNILRFAQNIAQDDSILDGLANDFMKSVKFEGGGAQIPLELWQNGQEYRVLNKVFNKLGIHCDIEQKHFWAIKNLTQGGGGKTVDLPFGFVAYNDYDRITICPKGQKIKYTFEIPFALGETVTPIGTVEASYSGGGLRVDLDKLPSGTVFRTRRQGDMFTKFGGGTKPLNRYLIDKKIPERNRDGLLLLACGNEVLAIVGVEISDKVRVDDASRRIYLRIKSDE